MISRKNKKEAQRRTVRDGTKHATPHTPRNTPGGKAEPREPRSHPEPTQTANENNSDNETTPTQTDTHEHKQQTSKRTPNATQTNNRGQRTQPEPKSPRGHRRSHTHHTRGHRPSARPAPLEAPSCTNPYQTRTTLRGRREGETRRRPSPRAHTSSHQEAAGSSTRTASRKKHPQRQTSREREKEGRGDSGPSPDMGRRGAPPGAQGLNPGVAWVPEPGGAPRHPSAAVQ